LDQFDSNESLQRIIGSDSQEASINKNAQNIQELDISGSHNQSGSENDNYGSYT
jgi:hypothetical protein